MMQIDVAQWPGASDNRAPDDGGAVVCLTLQLAETLAAIYGSPRPPCPNVAT